MRVYRALALREDATVCEGLRLVHSPHLQTKMTIFFGTVQSTNDNKMSKVHARSHEITNKPFTSSYYKNSLTTDLKNKL